MPMEANVEMHFLEIHRAQIVYVVIAIVSGGLAAWLSVKARVWAALASAAHARAAYKMVNTKYQDSIKEIAVLRRQIAKLTAENDALTGRSSESSSLEDDWEARQRDFDEAAAEFDKSEKARAIATAPAKSTKEIKREQSVGRAATEITQALELLDKPSTKAPIKQGRFSFRAKPPKDGYRDNDRGSKDS